MDPLNGQATLLRSAPLLVLSVAALFLVILAAPTALAEPFLLPAHAQGSWVGADKELHFAGSLAISASFRVTGMGDGQSFGATVGIGVLKEIFDATLKPRRKGRGASWKDLIADALGAAAGIAIVGAIDR